ncbi:MAG: HNH endonuclease [Petrotogales bacterium]
MGKKKSVSDSYLEMWWRKTVRVVWNNKCAFCGKVSDDLQCHHIIKRRKRLTRYDWRNGILLCSECHREADTKKGELKIKELIPHIYETIIEYENVLYKHFLTNIGMTDNEFRKIELQELKDKYLFTPLPCQPVLRCYYENYIIHRRINKRYFK